MPDSPAGSARPQTRSTSSATFEIKSAQLPLVALLVKSPNLKMVGHELLSKFGPEGESSDFFDHDAVVLDFSTVVSEDSNWEDGGMDYLQQALLSCHLVPVAFRSKDANIIAAARDAGLVEAPLETQRVKSKSIGTKDTEPQKLDTEIKEVVREVVREIPGPATMVVDKPLRSGQKVYARGADLVVLAPVNQGAEIAADGNIHVYAPLRGKAMAGARGNVQARIFSICMEPELISIAGVYRTSENPFPPQVQGKPAQVRLSNDGQDKLLIEALKI